MAKLCLSKIIVKVTILIISLEGFSACVAQTMVVCVVSLCYVSWFRHFGECVAFIFRVTEFGSGSQSAFLIFSFELHEYVLISLLGNNYILGKEWVSLLVKYQSGVWAMTSYSLVGGDHLKCYRCV
jgi:Fe2+ transport system protein B